ncbi:MAG: 7-carboxy-7-deazaguanine synthase QueE [Nitrospirae bacterium CG18_big_fil_WC_8_21_14_2_50_70_55]|nr:radical SAM protein [Deltaproteobacteria bacterium]PIQ04273.1 MAG: 7-carboxy-7-deazaguanine synthase QueE [Nitrospirae bacterium CG18_big_fil_WC_8_21_14_2_50_70_55]PIU79835.1 MAG: 7-carboxy-7-deazaguanine synthase QueE [Nitrospirae bacterium CG06_land_8_20_14_3_00_70_43]PIW83402.1 MAG: 7-carboxy-7-deazaguanine synthase QueE [Nitrospirae bacterium CG_4_8_14_3_um_filter_70_85]PIX82184.1 MAG: 7-carboxy-7-deazaguanine synthase QueE [Nitrospirae bacterium CG_4_10_14_3_um_filter_70_108]PJB96173.1
MRVTEIFTSIQGESTFAGLPCTFVRLTGCPLRCAYCDTAYAFAGGTEMAVDQVVAQVAAAGVALVEVTGGEPLAQRETPALLARLLAAGHSVLLETSNCLPINAVPEGVHVILDLKSPGSGEVAANRWENLELLDARGEIKFVLTGRADFDWAVATLEAHHLAGRWPLLFAPVFGALDPAELAAWILAARLPVRLQLQLHKLVWGPERTGV